MIAKVLKKIGMNLLSITNDNQIYIDPLTNEYYLDIETSE